jgi:hypothetical protein
MKRAPENRRARIIETVLVQREMEGSRCLLDTCRPWGGGFQGMGSIARMRSGGRVGEGCGAELAHTDLIRQLTNEPTGSFLGAVASQQSRLWFHLAGSV